VAHAQPPQLEQLPIEVTVPEDLFRPRLGEPHHSAYVVEDIDTTVSRLVDQLGAAPFFLLENVPLENVLSRGQPAEFIHSSAFGYWAGVTPPAEQQGADPLLPVRVISTARCGPDY